MKGILEVSIIPIKLHAENASLSDIIAKFFKELQKGERVEVKIYPTSTVLLGELEDIFTALRKALENTISPNDIPRIVSFMKLDLRIDKEATPESKINSVMEKIRG